MGTSTPFLNLYKPDDTELVDVEVHLNDNMDKIDLAVENLDDTPKGKLWRTSGFTPLPAISADIDFEANRVHNGMAASPSSQGLVIPISGLYRVHVYGYSSGGGAPPYDTQYIGYRIRTATANKTLVFLSVYKPNSLDYSGYASNEVPLAANDEIRVQGNSTGGAVSTWGIDEASGVRLEVEFIGVLDGAVPI